MIDSVPVIDLSPSFIGGADGRRRVAAEIGRACQEIGFFTIVGHGVPAAITTELEEKARAFFTLPLEEKERIPQPAERISRGYSRVGSRGLAYSTGTSTPPDLQESFAMGPIGSAPEHLRGTVAERYFFLENRFPVRPEGFRSAFEAYYRSMETLSLRLLRLFARALDLDESFFDDKVHEHTSTMRAIFYPPQPDPPEPGQLRAGAHTDYGTLTILKGEDVPGGLQVQLRGGGWVDVHPRADSFVCNIGDMMMRWTNDHWVSNPHRVVNPPRAAAHIGRLSIPFFHNINADGEIRCIGTIRGRGQLAKYEPVRFGDYFLSKHLKAQHMTTELVPADDQLVPLEAAGRGAGSSLDR